MNKTACDTYDTTSIPVIHVIIAAVLLRYIHNLVYGIEW